MSEIDALDMARSSIILLLSEKPLHGYAIMKEVGRRIDRPLNPSLLYPFLKQLEEAKLVRSIKKPVGQKPRKVYELTDEGKELASRIYIRIASMISLTMKPNLSICFHCGCKIYEGGYRETLGNRETIFCCIHCAQAFKSEFPKRKNVSEKKQSR